jgi:hypothetical protein
MIPDAERAWTAKQSVLFLLISSVGGSRSGLHPALILMLVVHGSEILGAWEFARQVLRLVDHHR